MRLLVVVPKWDELRSVSWGFGHELHTAAEISPSGARYHPFTRDFGTSTAELIAVFMDSQNNTNAAVITTEAILRFDPDSALLVGTALGNPARVSIGSVVIATSIDDMVERSLGENGETRLRVSTIRGSAQLLDLARAAVAEIGASAISNCVYSAASELHIMHETDVKRFLQAQSPSIGDEIVASGNDYFMGTDDPAASVWAVSSKASAYDMESAGFARACETLGVRWLVLRGISDFGTPSTKSANNRTISAALAARIGSAVVDRIGTEESFVTARAKPNEPLKTLDEVRSLTDLLSSANRVDVLSRTAVNVLGSYQHDLLDLMSRGGRVRILMVDPESQVARYLYGKNYETYRANLGSTHAHITRLRSDSSAENFAIRTIAEFPPFSILNAASAVGATMHVQLNMLHARVGRDRPVIELDLHSRWYNIFMDEFEQMWNQSKDYDDTSNAGS